MDGGVVLESTQCSWNHDDPEGIQHRTQHRFIRDTSKPPDLATGMIAIGIRFQRRRRIGVRIKADADEGGAIWSALADVHRESLEAITEHAADRAAASIDEVHEQYAAAVLSQVELHSVLVFEHHCGQRTWDVAHC